MLDQLDAPDQLRLLAKCLDGLDLSRAQPLLSQGGFAPTRDGDRRRYPRKRVQQPAPMQVIGTLPSLRRTPLWHAVQVIDISRGGLSLLHSQQLFPTERLRAVIQDGAFQVLEVVWCQRISDRCYQVGCKLLASSD